MKKTLKVALYILLALVLIVLAYVIYVFAAYYRVAVSYTHLTLPTIA